MEGEDASFGRDVDFEVISIAAEVEPMKMNDVSGGVHDEGRTEHPSKDKMISRKVQWCTYENR